MTLKSCRQTLEEDMGLESGALKPFKQLLSDNIDKVPRTACGLRCLVTRLPLFAAGSPSTRCRSPVAAPWLLSPCAAHGQAPAGCWCDPWAGRCC